MNRDELKRVGYIKELLKAKDLEYSDFGVSKSLIARVVNGRLKTRYLQIRIARRLGTPVNDLFPAKPNIRRGAGKRNKAAGR